MPSFTWTVRSTDEIFIYCGAPGSCNKAGMVMMVNPNGSLPFELYRQAALSAPYVLTPGEPFPQDENHGSGGTEPTTSITSSSSPSNFIQPSVDSINQSDSTTHNKDLATITGIIVGGISAMALIGFLILLIFRRRRHSTPSLSDQYHRDSAFMSSFQPVSSIPQSSNPHSYSTGDTPNIANQYTPELAPNSPQIRPYLCSLHGQNGSGPQTRETVIIPVTEEEKAMYLERLHGIQSGINSGGVSPISTNGGEAGGHSQLRRSADPINPRGVPNLAARYNIARRSPSRSTRGDEYGTRRRPAEMATSKFEENMDSRDEDMKPINSTDEANGREKGGQFYPIHA
ncbi:hypothetical protein H072_10105 [Dactylellina haptotyla CBS 200.50]|uniref:Phytocyanin domain-containing protein n=1 Tax=Dactylellina haptotyla (strain CBS 200.50) TaxID=1284197 RepID=S8A5K1_DACHA|nr:hypothetical protein H072_10105 [Dactylellina haptotyla CBS 200.50]